MKPSDFDLEYQNQNIESKIVVALERISQSFRSLLWQESTESSLSPIQIQFLIFLLHHSKEKRKVSYLAQEFNLSKATVSETIKLLIEKKLAYKTNAPNDSRSFIISLTDYGRKVAKDTSTFSSEINNPIDLLTEKDKEVMLLSLLNIIKHLNQTGVISIQRMCWTCEYYRNLKNQQHFCNFLNQELTPTELRIDCPEHLLTP